MSLPAPGTRPQWAGQEYDSAAPSELAHEQHVFHEMGRGESPDLIEHLVAQEDALITVCHAEQAYT